MTLLSPPSPTAAPAGAPVDSDPRAPDVRFGVLFDPGTVELLPGDPSSGMWAATGLVDGGRTVAFCADPRVMGGAMGREGCEVVVRAYERALEESAPIVGIWHSGGARLAEGVASLDGVG